MHVVEVMNRGADQFIHVKREVEPLLKAVRDLDPQQAHFYKRGEEELALVKGLGGG